MRQEVLAACEQMLKRPGLTAEQRAEIYNLRAGAYTGLGRFAEAEADFGRAIEVDRSVVEYYENRAQMYELSGNMTRALADQARVAELRSRR